MDNEITLKNLDFYIDIPKKDEVKTIYHYTNYESFLKIVHNKNIFSTDFRYLNDYLEIEHTYEIALETSQTNLNSDQYESVLKVINEVKNTSIEENPVYITSFSLVKDSLPQWRAYASNGGVALGFKIKQIQNVLRESTLRKLELSTHMGKCVYDDLIKEKIIKSVVNQSLIWGKYHDTEQFSKFFVYGLYLFAPFLKNISFKEEKEIRIRVNKGLTNEYGNKSPHIPDVRIGLLGLTPFMSVDLETNGIPFVLQEIIVGPSNNQNLMLNSIKHVLGKYELNNVKLIKSTIPYRTS